MTVLTLPNILTHLPASWNITSASGRSAQVTRLKHERTVIDAALMALDHCLAAIPQLGEPVLDGVPESLISYWDFTAEWLAETMPTLTTLR